MTPLDQRLANGLDAYAADTGAATRITLTHMAIAAVVGVVVGALLFGGLLGIVGGLMVGGLVGFGTGAMSGGWNGLIGVPPYRAMALANQYQQEQRLEQTLARDFNLTPQEYAMVQARMRSGGHADQVEAAADQSAGLER